MTVLDKRWIEIQFYSICHRLFKINNDIQDILAFIEVLGSVYHFNIEHAKMLAQKLIIQLRAKSKRKELALLAREKGIHIDRIVAITGYHKRYVYDLCQTNDVQEFLRYYPSWTDAELELMQKVIDSVTQIKEWTI